MTGVISKIGKSAGRVLLGLFGLLFIAAGGVGAGYSIHHHAVTTAVTSPPSSASGSTPASQTVTTTVNGSVPSDAVITGCFGIGAACLIVAGFINRVSEVTAAGVDIKLDQAASTKLVKKATAKAAGLGDVNPETVSKLYDRAVRALADGSVDTATTRALSAGQHGDVEDATFDRAIDHAAEQI